MDSRLRGNDGRGFGKNCSPPVFRRPIAPSVCIVAWALPTMMLGKKGRLQFFHGQSPRATGFYSHATVFAVGRILESDISN